MGRPPRRTPHEQAIVEADARRRLDVFYKYYNPEQRSTAHADTVLKAYKGDEAQLFADLAKMYDGVPLPDRDQMDFEQELAELGPLPREYAAGEDEPEEEEDEPEL